VTPDLDTLLTELDVEIDEAVAGPRELINRCESRSSVSASGSVDGWGISRLMIREGAIGKLAPLLPRLHETAE
jgi:hypothetical protein